MTSPHPLAVRFPALPNPAWLPERAWPFETFQVETDEDVLAVSEIGSGPALLFAHVGTWSFIWCDLMKMLAPDFRCITLDAPGNGRSRSTTGSPVTMNRASTAIE